jgi:hypothetical protein
MISVDNLQCIKNVYKRRPYEKGKNHRDGYSGKNALILVIYHMIRVSNGRKNTESFMWKISKRLHS